MHDQQKYAIDYGSRIPNGKYFNIKHLQFI